MYTSALPSLARPARRGQRSTGKRHGIAAMLMRWGTFGISLLLAVLIVGCGAARPATTAGPQNSTPRPPVPSGMTREPKAPAEEGPETSIESNEEAGNIDATREHHLPLVLFGTLIDGTGAEPLIDGALVVRGGRIAAVGRRDQIDIPSGAQVVDVPGTTILPGLINAHVHNAYIGSNLKAWAMAGVTTVRDLGAPYGRNYLARRERLAGDPQHARLVAAGPLVTVPGGYPIAGNDFPSLTVTSAEDAREKISALIDDGADVIKITLTSGSAPSLSPKEAAAIVEAAHARGVPVSAHATTAKDLERALDAGVDDVAHIATDRVSDKLIRRMVAANTSWVPTLAVLEGRGASNLQRFLRAGGRVSLGNDAGYLDAVLVGLPANELAALEAAGMSRMEIIAAATRNAAAVCRLQDQLGTLEAGKIADVLVVAGDPLRDLDALKDVLIVVHQGIVIRREPPPETLPAGVVPSSPP